MNGDRIAIVGIGLEYPDATDTGQLWENILAGRRAFRDIPKSRTNLDDYWDADPSAPDQFYSRKAAVLRDYQFDRIRHRISSGTFRATDMTQWLALDVAGRALADAGFPNGEGLPTESTGCIIGNSLTGEFSRSTLMRLRWPYVRRAVAAQLEARDWTPQEIDAFVTEMEPQYKAPFPVPSEDSLAGGLANTIAGRVCNYYDFGGGGYTVDGACSSSLLSVANAANSLRDGSLDVAIAGGVDLSIDPFELIGFSRTSALATGEMKVYDAGSNGFWPGEGCGMVVLMREQDALEQNRDIYACISGWGISSDGRGGITRPEADGHLRAIHRAYEQAGYTPDTVSYFEGHGTGTAVGDATEISALARTREGSTRAAPAALGTIKANFGHTKAAAGVAGLIKATLAVHQRTIPPITGHTQPHPALLEAANQLYAPTQATAWPTDVPIRAGVSAMGFGGINTHIALEQVSLEDTSRPKPDLSVAAIVRGRQDSEAILIGADDRAGLTHETRRVKERLAGASMSELADIAAAASATSQGKAFRAAVSARSPEEAVCRLEKIEQRLSQIATGTEELTSIERLGPGSYLGWKRRAPRIGYVFPGQGAGTGQEGAIARRFGQRVTDRHLGGGTESLQPRVVARSLDVADALEQVGVSAQAAAGHSLGEISALAWSGALSREGAVEVAAERGSCMARLSPTDGAMAVVSADRDTTGRLIEGTDAVISGFNAPQVTVVAGRQAAVEQVCALAEKDGVTTARLQVDHAFHTEDFRDASVAFKDFLQSQAFQPLKGSVYSTVTGRDLGANADLRTHLASQMVHPVNFVDAVSQMEQFDLVIEVGPGTALSGLVTSTIPGVVVARTDSDSQSLLPFLDSVAAAYVAGADISAEALHQGRVVREVDLDHQPTFLANACEAAPHLGFVPSDPVTDTGAEEDSAAQEKQTDQPAEDASTLETLRKQISEQVDLPQEMVADSTKPLDELHMSSITIGQVINDVVRALGRPALNGVPSFATASVREIAAMLDEAHESGDSADDQAPQEVPGTEPWVRPFVMENVPETGPSPDTPKGESSWDSVGEVDPSLITRLQSLPGPQGLAVDLRSAGQQLDVAEQTLAWVKTAQDVQATVRIAVLQGAGRGLSGLVKSLHLEHPDVPVTLITLPQEGPLSPDLVDQVCSEVHANRGFVEVVYDADGQRRVPRLSVVQAGREDSPLHTGDVLLATGGAKGITAEACLELGRRFGVAIALIGRSPADSDSVSATLQRLHEAEIPHQYIQADVLSQDGARHAIAELEDALGPITAVLHGAGINEPKPALDLTREDFETTLAPKITGLRHILDAIDVSNLKLVVGFTSIIGRGGLYGEGHYALANDWLTHELEQLATDHPHVRVRSLEWSVWTGAGMGDRLGVVERLKQQGIEAIGTASGLEELMRAVCSADFPTTTVVCARTGNLPTLQFREQDLPLSRYLERVVVHYPGVELIAEADLGTSTDLYLSDHNFEGTLLLPAVMGMEAMVEVARSLVDADDEHVTLSDIVFERPIVVPADAAETVRVCAVADPRGEVRLVIRTSSTDFGADHFRATVRFGGPPHHLSDGPAVAATADLPPVHLDPLEELYGNAMFQGERFQKIISYQRAAARDAVVEVDPSCRGDWFASFLPQDLILGDPGARDALMHSLQCCVPNATLLPHSVERIDVARQELTGPLTMNAHEREGDGEWFVYDLTVRDKAGSVVEEWLGLRIRAVSRRSSSEISWSPSFLGAYLERNAETLLGGNRAIVVEPHGENVNTSVADRRRITTLAAQRSRGAGFELTYRADGRPETSDGSYLSSSHDESLTITAMGTTALAVDVERIRHQSLDDWKNLLGDQAFATAQQVSAETHDDPDTAATRVWGALECLRKVGYLDPAVHLGSVQDDGWVRFTVGGSRIATWAGHIRTGEYVSFAILSGA